MSPVTCNMSYVFKFFFSGEPIFYYYPTSLNSVEAMQLRSNALSGTDVIDILHTPMNVFSFVFNNYYTITKVKFTVQTSMSPVHYS